jgi:glycerate kinase
MKILLIPDSFKGTLTSQEVINIIKMELSIKYPSACIVGYPFADGGEGSLACLKEVLSDYQEFHKEVIACELDNTRDASYLISNNKAIIDSSLVMGLPYSKKNPFITTTYGVGQLILDALDKGSRKFIITIGGSSTNDGGAGMLSALGVTFYHQNKLFIPTGGTLKDIDMVDTSHLDKRLKDCEFKILSDVTNPLLGSQGATYTYALQKGASKHDLPLLEEGMKHYASLLNNHKEEIPGSGAAGGLGYGFLSFLNSRIVSGAQEILNLYHFDERIADIDIVITGEGKTDASSLQGKCISVVAKHCQNKRLILLSGYVDPRVYDSLKEIGFSEIYSIQQDTKKSFEEIKAHAEDDLKASVVKYISC